MTATQSLVSAHDLVRRFGEGPAAVEALRGVTIGFQPGEFTAIVGPSGSGKSTLMHCLAGLDRPTAGEIEIDGRPLASLSDTELTKLRRERIGFIFQSFNLLPVLSARENVELPLTLGGASVDDADPRGLGHPEPFDRGSRQERLRLVAVSLTFR